MCQRQAQQQKSRMRSSRVKPLKSTDPSPVKSLNNTHHQEPSPDLKSEIKPQGDFSKLTRGQKSKLNTQLFPYRRSCHYYQDLALFPRVEQTSYVRNLNPHGTFHDSRLLQTYQTASLINREYFGLPCSQEHKKTKDKNICHQYLFKNQDKKWRLDQTLYQLKYILTHPQILEQNRANTFSSVKKDFQLSVLFDEEQELEQKQEALRRKIEALEHRRERLREEMEQEDQLFYKPSLNQEFFNQKEEQDRMFNVQQIVMEAVCMAELNQLIYSKVQPDSVEESKLKILFSVFTTTDKDMPVFEDEFKKYMRSGKAQEKVIPSFIFNFKNKESLSWVGQVLLMRVYQVHGESGFYALKNTWKALFDEDLVMRNEYQEIDVGQYVEAMRVACERQRPKKLSVCTRAIQLPQVHRHKFYFQQNKASKISTKDYVALYLIYYLYQRVTFLNLDYRLVGSELFNKYQYTIVEKIPDKSVASVDLVIKKCCDLMVESLIDTEIPIQLYSEYNTEARTLMVWAKQRVEEGSEGESGDSSEESEDDAAIEDDEELSSYLSSSLEFPTKRRRLI